MSEYCELGECDRNAKERIKSDFDKFGFHIAGFLATSYSPSFAYTIGFYKTFGHPEIICIGLSTDLMFALMQTVDKMLQEGEKIEVGKLYDDFLDGGYHVQFLPVDKLYYPDYMGYGKWFYDKTEHFPTLQLVWPDMDNVFPWEDRFDEKLKYKQPLLDRNTDFKFREERNLCVFTTKQVLAGEPILYVHHDEDGDWQFLNCKYPKKKDAVLVCMEEVVKLDLSVNWLSMLEYGEYAWRKSKDEIWSTEKIDKK